MPCREVDMVAGGRLTCMLTTQSMLSMPPDAKENQHCTLRCLKNGEGH